MKKDLRYYLLMARHRYRIEDFGGVSEWFGPAPRRWARTLSRKVVWLRVV